MGCASELKMGDMDTLNPALKLEVMTCFSYGA